MLEKCLKTIENARIEKYMQMLENARKYPKNISKRLKCLKMLETCLKIAEKCSKIYLKISQNISQKISQNISKYTYIHLFFPQATACGFSKLCGRACMCVHCWDAEIRRKPCSSTRLGVCPSTVPEQCLKMLEKCFKTPEMFENA